MKIGLIGFGRAGKAVANVILLSKKHSLEWVLRERTLLDGQSAKELLGVESSDPATVHSRTTTNLDELFSNEPVDAVIDFSGEQSIYLYGPAAASSGVMIISAISHYSDKEKEFLQELSGQTKVFWSANITVGVNFLLFAASMLQKITPDVDVEIIEEHFKAKSGVSGTALKIAEVLELESESINSVRAGGIVGKHEVVFGFPYQTVRLVHESISREAFGSGALFVAEKLKEKPLGYYNFESILAPLLFGDSSL